MVLPKIMVVVFIVCLGACATNQYAGIAPDVQILKQAPDCKYTDLGQVTGISGSDYRHYDSRNYTGMSINTSGNRGSRAEAEARLRQAAKAVGANAVIVIAVKVTGRHQATSSMQHLGSLRYAMTGEAIRDCKP